jgi:hypothetical protein
MSRRYCAPRSECARPLRRRRRALAQLRRPGGHPSTRPPLVTILSSAPFRHGILHIRQPFGFGQAGDHPALGIGPGYPRSHHNAYRRQGTPLELDRSEMPVNARVEQFDQVVPRRGRYTCVSGSPNRALNSDTRGPSFVSINPGYSNPRKSMPSAAQLQPRPDDVPVRHRQMGVRENGVGE